MSKITSGTITTTKGFYVGDLCYALNDKVYDEVWGGVNYKDGIHEVPGTGCSFAVAGTAYGDGIYEDSFSLRQFEVDAGNLSLVPGELVEDTDGGHYYEGAGTASFTAEDGVFDINLPDGTCIHIDTKGWEDEEDDYYEEEEEDAYSEEDDYEE